MSAPAFDLASWAASAPPGALVPAAAVAEYLSARPAASPPLEPGVGPGSPSSWREKLWTAPAEMRLGVIELCEAVDRPSSWVYRHTSSKSGLSLLPHRKFDGALVFLAGEIRAWIQQNETVLVPGRQSLELRRRA